MYVNEYLRSLKIYFLNAEDIVLDIFVYLILLHRYSHSSVYDLFDINIFDVRYIVHRGCRIIRRKLMKKKVVIEVTCGTASVGLIVLGLVFPEYKIAWWLAASLLIAVVETFVLQNRALWLLTMVI